MAERIAYLEAVVGADITSFRRGMQEVRRETGILSDTIGGLGRLGRNMTLAVTAPLAALATSAVTAAASFDATMRNINSIAFLTEDNLKKLSDRTLEFGSSIRSGPQAAAEALNTVFQAGITDIDTAFNVMQVGAKTAEAGLADLTRTTEGLVAAALTFGDQSPQALQKYSDAITLAVQLGVGSMDSFNTGFANAMGTAAAVGQSFEEMAAVTAFLTQRGIQAGAAGTYLNNALTKLIKPTEDMTALWDKMGVKSGKELLETFGGFVPALRAIHKELGNNEAEWAKIFNDVRGFKAVSRIFTAFEEDGTDAISAYFDEFAAKMAEGGVTMSAWEQQMMSFEAQWGLLTSAVQGFSITIGNLLLPILTPVVNGFTEFIQHLQATDPVLLKIALAFTGVVAAAGPLLWLLSSLLSPIGALLAIGAALAVAWTENWNGIRDTVTQAITDILGPLDDLKKGVEIFFSTLFGETPTVNPGQAVGDATTNSTVRAPVTFELLPSYDPKFKGIAELAEMNNVSVDDILKALGFKTLEEAMGAKAGKYTINFDVELQPNGWDNNTDFMTMPGQAGSRWQDGAAVTEGDNSIGGRLQRAIDTAWPVIQPALDRMWTNIKNWFETTFIPGVDDAGGDVLNSIAGWFGSGNGEDGQTPVYNALRDLLKGDIKQAAADAGAWFDENFPETRKGLENFANKFGTWFTDEAVPTVARGIGYFAATLVSTIASAIPTAFSMITGGAGEAAGAATSFIGDKVLEPMRQGIQQGIADQGIGGGDAIVTSFATQLTLLFAGNKLLTALIGQDIGGKIFGKIGSAIAATSISKSIVGLEGKLAGFASAIGTKIVAAIAAFVTSPITLGITLGTLLYIAIPKQWKDELHKAVSNLLDGAFGAGTTDNFLKEFETRGYEFVRTWARITGDKTLEHAANVNLGIDDSPETLERAKQAALRHADTFNASLVLGLMNYDISYADLPWLDTLWKNAVTDFLADPNNQVDVNSFVSNLITTSGVSNWSQEEQDAFRQAMVTGLNLVLTDIVVTPTVKVGTPIIGTATEGGDTQSVWSALNQALGGGELPAPENPIAADVDKMIVYTPESAQRSVDGLNTLVTDTIAGAVAAGNFNGQPIADSLVAPIETAFQTAFGAEGTVGIAWNAFITDYMLKAGGLALNFVALGIGVNLLKSTFVSAFTTMRDKVVELIGEISSHIAGLNSTIEGVGNAVGGAAGTAGVGGTTPLPGRASGGSAMGWTMVGERGPELVHFGDKGMVIPTRMLRNMNGGSSGTTVNNVQINGVQDVDGLLFELERRGIVIA